MIRVAILILAISTLISSTGLCKDYSIEELLDVAAQNSANIRSAEYLAKSQKHLANQQKYWNNPSVEFGKIGGQETYGINQSIPFYNKLQNKYDIEDAQYRALDVRRENLALFVKADLFSLLYQYQGLKKKIELTKKRLNRLSLVDKYLTTIVLSSPTKKAQSRITKDRINLVERDLIKLQNKLYQTWNAANVYLNLESEPNEIIDFQWLSDKNYQGKKFLINAALENNLQLKEQKILISKAKSELSYAKIEQMPDINISATRQAGSSASGISNGNSSNGIGLSLSLPLINRNQEKIVSSESQIKSQEATLEFERNQLIQLISNDISQYETSLKLTKNFPITQIDKTIDRLSTANSDFKKGVLDFITYIELDSQEYQIIDTIIDTQIDLASSYSSLMTKVGSFTIPSQK
ncbi:MAG: TolC family protein [Proteobacteria bacterium]|nr:TolC family protein [Pseudomonadota bacterium]